MQQASLSKFYSSTTTASSSTSTDGANAADEEGSSTDGEQDSDGDDLHPPPAKRVDTQVRGRRPRKDHHPRSGFSSSWLKEFKWLEHVDEDGTTGLKCKVCSLAKHHETGRVAGVKNPQNINTPLL